MDSHQSRRIRELESSYGSYLQIDQDETITEMRDDNGP